MLHLAAVTAVANFSARASEDAGALAVVAAKLLFLHSLLLTCSCIHFHKVHEAPVASLQPMRGAQANNRAIFIPFTHDTGAAYIVVPFVFEILFYHDSMSLFSRPATRCPMAHALPYGLEGRSQHLSRDFILELFLTHGREPAPVVGSVHFHTRTLRWRHIVPLHRVCKQAIPAGKKRSCGALVDLARRRGATLYTRLTGRYRAKHNRIVVVERYWYLAQGPTLNSSCTLSHQCRTSTASVMSTQEQYQSQQ
jgi:hypothetical protein